VPFWILSLSDTLKCTKIRRHLKIQERMNDDDDDDDDDNDNDENGSSTHKLSLPSSNIYLANMG